MAIIEVEGLSKAFHVTRKAPGLRGAVSALVRPRREVVTAVDGVSFIVEPGEMVGYIGVNGAGKSTTIKLLTGILLPSAGRIRVLGRDPHRQRQANARDIGVVFGQRSQLWWDLPVVESLRLIGRIYQVEPAHLRRQLDRFAEVLDLGPLLAVPVRALSLGQKMRAELAATLLHEPKVVYLDEPTIGLDLMVKERIRDFIKQVNRELGTTVMLTTHDLGDIEELCRRVVVIDAGRLLWDGPLDTLREQLGTHRRMIFDTAAPAGEIPLPPGVEVEAAEPRRLTLRFDRALATASQVATAVMGRVEVHDFRLEEPDLGSIIRRIYGGALRGEEGERP
jgi:ABC-2 type transport system ATP-binding protein